MINMFGSLISIKQILVTPLTGKYISTLGLCLMKVTTIMGLWFVFDGSAIGIVLSFGGYRFWFLVFGGSRAVGIWCMVDGGTWI